MTALVSRSMDEELPRLERFACRLHLVYCKACRRYKNHLLTLREAIRRGQSLAPETGLPSSATLSPEARKRMLGKMTKE